MTAYHDTHIPYLATFAVDMLFMVPFIVFAVIIGQPLSVTTCSDLPKEASKVALPISSLAGQPVSYVIFTGSGRTVCYELMAVWGLIIALCVLFAISSIAAGFLFLGKRRSNSDGSVMGSGGPPGSGTFPGGGGYPMNESQIEMAPHKGSAFSSRSPSIGPDASMPGTPMPHNAMSPAGSFDGPPRRGPPGGFDGPPPPPSPGFTASEAGSRPGSFDERPHPGYPLSPPPPPRR